MTIKLQKAGEHSGHKSSIYCLEFFNDKLYSAGSDRLIVRWDGPDEGVSIASSTSAIYSLQFIENDNILLAGNADGEVHIIDMLEGKETRKLKPASSPLFKIIQIKSCGLIAILSGEGDVFFYTQKSYVFVRKLHVSDSKLRAVAFDESEKVLLVGCGKGIIYSIDINTFRIIRHFQAHKANFSVNSILIHPFTKEIISGSRDGHINVYSEHQSHELLQRIPAHYYAIYSLGFIGDDLLISVSRDKSIKLWDAKDRSFILKEDGAGNGHSYSVNTLCVPEKGNRFFTAGDDRIIKDWVIQKTPENRED